MSGVHRVFARGTGAEAAASLRLGLVVFLGCLSLATVLEDPAQAQNRGEATKPPPKSRPATPGKAPVDRQMPGAPVPPAAVAPKPRNQPIDPLTMTGSGSHISLNGSTFQVGLQSSLSSLRSVESGLPSGASVSGDVIVVTEARLVLEGYDFRGYSVSVEADNVTIRDCLFDAKGYHTVHQEEGSTGMVVEYSTFDGQKAHIDTHSDMVLSVETATIRNNEFLNLPSDAINVAGGIVERNYFAGASYQSGAHADAISVHRTVAPLIIRENYIDYIDRPDAAQGSNAAIKIVSHFGTIRDVTVDSNVLLGGGYTIYTGPDKHPVSDVTFSNNDVGLGQYGVLMGGDHGTNFVYVRNHSFSNDARLLAGSASNSGPTSPAEKLPEIK
jgi:hypothetical protein